MPTNTLPAADCVGKGVEILEASLERTWLGDLNLEACCKALQSHVRYSFGVYRLDLIATRPLRM